MKLKILILLLIISSLFGFLEWGGGHQAFLYEAEYDIFRQMWTDAQHIIHPFVLIPLLGQLLLLIALLQNKPNKWLVYAGIACLSLLLVFMLIIGIMSFNYKIITSTLPFIILAIWMVKKIQSGSKRGRICLRF